MLYIIMILFVLQDGDLFVVIDFGLNSFYMVIVCYMFGQLWVVDCLCEMVCMVDGLDGKGGLFVDVWQCVLECLVWFGQCICVILLVCVCVLVINIVCQLCLLQVFLMLVEIVLGYVIEVVSGCEEVCLIYLGVVYVQLFKVDQCCLVIDIGGGFIEFIIGQGMQILECESLQVGCIVSMWCFFFGGKFSCKCWKDVLIEIGVEFQQFVIKYCVLGWYEVFGLLGIYKVISEICVMMKLSKGVIIVEVLLQLCDELFKVKWIDDIDLFGLLVDCCLIIVGGILVLEVVFQVLGLQKLLVSKVVMCEGILYDIFGCVSENDLCDELVVVFSLCYGIDIVQVECVECIVMDLFGQVDVVWGLDFDDVCMLGWVVCLYELGLMIVYSGYYVYGSYVLENFDIVGFLCQEQQLLVVLVCIYCCNVFKVVFDVLFECLLLLVCWMVVLLWLVVLFNCVYEDIFMLVLELIVDDIWLLLIFLQVFIDVWLLLCVDLIGEIEGLVGLGMQFRLFVV